MCGIVGVVGNKNTTDILLQGLEKLEYRGYDSAGIYVTSGVNRFKLIKAVGRISDLRAKIGIDISGSAGIGHTRWATHGKPTVDNAHPHLSQSGRFVLVHNGVIENFVALREKYLADVKLAGETDTEIAVNLIAKLVERDNLSTQEAFQKALSLISGSFAFALMDTTDMGTIYVAKRKSPLLIGLGEDYNMVCSDAMAMIRETNQFLEIHDDEMVILRKDELKILTITGAEVVRKPFTAELDLSDIGKGTFPFYMLKEINDQPTVIRTLLQKYTNGTGEMMIDEAILADILASDQLYVVAAGTSENAGWASKQTFEQLTGIPVSVHTASEFAYNFPILSKKPFFIYLTQSGETADLRQVLVETNRLGLNALTITNVPGSTLSREAAHTLLLHAGPEIAVASTKAYTAQVAMMLILAKAIGVKLSNPQAVTLDLVRELGIAATAIAAIVDMKEVIDDLTYQYTEDTRNCFYIGRGSDYHVAKEASLKMKEISYIQCEGFAAGELKHGTIALIEEGTPVIALISDLRLAPHTRGNLMEVYSRGANTLVIATEACAIDEDEIVIPNVHPLLTPLVTVIPTQLLAYYASLHRGLDVDKPRNLAKSVTVE
ncbi:MAG: glutamine--fructose-6-phosphate transaminase (isomerizing) [Streptococcaceae bacterium]|jgi:glucosamine--fructose-6-phosphate aminotransferase (isomerizing)|nr:glutamine--fructose-6-phosphate transaminase (isomerizing) [Streptococcaceae bacterium]